MVDKRTTPIVPLWTVCSVNQSFELGGLGMTWGVNFSLLDNSSDYEAVQELNREKAKLLVPVIAYTIILLVVGAVGNTLAIYIYGFKWHSTTTRVFLLWLAMVDLINCCITMPTEIYIITRFYSFRNATLCRSSRFITHFTNGSSAGVYLAIAVDRYIRICHPFEKPLTIKWAKLACVLSTCVGFSTSWPALLLYGNYYIYIPGVRNEDKLVLGIMCDINNLMDRSVYSKGFFTYLWCAFFTSFLAITIIYILIAKVMLQRLGEKSEMAKNIQQRENDSDQKVDDISMSSFKSLKEKIKRNLEKRKRRTPRLTMMLFAISAVFMMSFMPYLVVMTIRQYSRPCFYHSLSPWKKVLLNLLLRSYLVNNCANPMLYGVINSQFREKVKDLFIKSKIVLDISSSHVESHAYTD